MILGVEDITGVVGVFPIPTIHDADRRSATSINVAETEKMVRGAIGAGIDIIMMASTLAECATLTRSDVQTLIGCVVEVTAKQRPVFAGLITHARDAGERSEHLVALGVDGLCIGRPAGAPMTDAQLVRYYRDLAQALPNIPLIISDDPLSAFDRISSETLLQLASIPGVVAATHFGGLTLEKSLAAVDRRLRILPPESAWYPMARLYPDAATACLSSFAACGPGPLTALGRAIRTRNWRAAGQAHKRIAWACQPLPARADVTAVLDYTVVLGHARLRAAGFIDPGPPRRPYDGVPRHFIEALRESGRRWASIRSDYP